MLMTTLYAQTQKQKADLQELCDRFADAARLDSMDCQWIWAKLKWTGTDGPTPTYEPW